MLMDTFSVIEARLRFRTRSWCLTKGFRDSADVLLGPQVTGVSPTQTWQQSGCGDRTTLPREGRIVTHIFNLLVR